MNPPVFPRPRYWAQAAEQLRRPKGVLGLILTAFLLLLIASVLESTVRSAILFIYILAARRDEFYAFMSSESVSFKEISEWISASEPDWFLYVTLIGEALLIIVVIFYCLVIEKRKLPTLGFTGRLPALEYLLGLCLGALLFGGVFLLGHAAGAYKGLTLRFTSRMLPPLALALAGFVIQSAAEELLVRGFFAVSMNKRYPVGFCVFTSSLVFAMLHLGNDASGMLPLINTFLVGVLLCMYVIKRGSIWGAMAFHAAWNFTQGCIFGFHVSGIPLGHSVFHPTVLPYNELLTGGTYGPEGSICTTIVLLAALFGVFLLRPRGELAPEEPIKAPEENS